MAHKVVIVGLENLNLGDRVIEDTCKYLVKEIAPDVKIRTMNLFPPEEIMKKYKSSYPKTDRKIRKLKENPKFFAEKKIKNFLIQLLNFSKWYRFSRKGLETYSYYEENLKKSKMVIIAGGGLIKYSREDFWNAIYSIVSYCAKARIHVYFNAIGVEGFDKDNFYCKLLKYSLNKKCVKMVTTRDDLATLQKYVKNKKKTKLVGDSALWCPEKYGIEVQKSDTIGVGLMRGKIFTDYGVNFDEEQIIQTYVGIVKELESRGYRWQLFCNGLKSDYKMGKDVLNRLGLPEEEQYLAPRPQKSESLVRRIYGYKAIIGARLHSCIIASSCGVPALGLVWNDKLHFFGEQIGFPERFVKKENFNDPKFIVNTLEQAILQGYNKDIIEELKCRTKNSLKEFIDKELGNCKK